ncbi:MAG: SPOR domain-containing protein [Parasphingorhabdus sp.]|uniref:SPOR domain-containing protein n=1 Tax=Parasphingorhabdus sp. TaxID=2709688 RepID=UPI0032647B0E
MKHKFKIILAISAALVGTSVPHATAIAKSSAQSNSADLQDALRRIARNSNDSSALADAGLAALELGDTRAAIGFLAKADQIYASSGRVKAGLGRALLFEENPFGAIRYFDQAIANGIPPKDIAADRGLAYDLVGRNIEAQKDYELAMRYGRDDQLIARYAISLGISGNVDAADAQLNPLLQKSDRDAWRNRAFIFAMNGKKKEANNIAKKTMERRMAKAIKPFLDGMPRLTAAQKAAAVHLGHFPASENIGVDVAAVQLASNMAVRGGTGADAGLIPVGEALGAKADRPRVLAMPDKSPRRRPGLIDRRFPDRKATRRVKKKEVVVLSRTELPAPDGTGTGSGGTADAVRAFLKSTPPPKPEPVRTQNKVEPTRVTSRKPEPPKLAKAQPLPVETAKTKTDITKPPFSNAGEVSKKQPPVLVSQTIERKVEIAGRKPGTRKSPPVAVKSPPVVKAKAETPVNLINFDLANSRSDTKIAAVSPASRPLSDIIKGINIPDKETSSKVVPVDLDKIEPAKAKPKIAPKPEKKEPVKPKEPEHPKRYWVQIATGSNLSALKYDYRRMSRKQPDLFKGNTGWTSPWGKTRRLVVGPFDDFKAAKAFEAGFRKGGGDGFAWVSAKGVEVNGLPK